MKNERLFEEKFEEYKKYPTAKTKADFFTQLHVSNFEKMYGWAVACMRRYDIKNNPEIVITKVFEVLISKPACDLGPFYELDILLHKTIEEVVKKKKF